MISPDRIPRSFRTSDSSLRKPSSPDCSKISGIEMPERFTISLSALAVASILGIVLNAILPGKDFEFKTEPAEDADTGVNFKV